MSPLPATDDIAQTWQSYQRLRVRLAATINRRLAERTGLSEADYEILALLSAADDFTMRSIALRCGLDWEKSRLSHQIRRMEERGLVNRAACEEDSRSSLVHLTDAGRAAIDVARPIYDEAVATFFGDAVSAEQARALDGIASSIMERIDAVEPPAHRA